MFVVSWNIFALRDVKAYVPESANSVQVESINIQVKAQKVKTIIQYRHMRALSGNRHLSPVEWN